MLAAAGPGAHDHYRYVLHVDIEPVEARVLRDAIEDEPFGLRDRYGMPALLRQLDAFEIDVNTSTTTRWADFESDIGMLSVYLSQYIVGYEVEVRPTPGAPRLSATKMVGRRGETVSLEADVRFEPRSGDVVVGEEDVQRMIERWDALPEWLRNAMRLKYPRLTKL